MAKNIYQLAKLARRLPRRLNGIRHALINLDKSSARTDYIEKLSASLVSRYQRLELAQRVLALQLAARNINGFAHRCALPLKQQRAQGPSSPGLVSVHYAPGGRG